MNLRQIIRSTPFVGTFLRALRSMKVTTSAPNGHFYSPVVNPEELTEETARIWPDDPATSCGLEFNDPSHAEILRHGFSRHLYKYDYPEKRPLGASDTQFYAANGQFGWLDARVLSVLLNELQPRRVLEVGSGFSTLLIADTNYRHLQGAIRFQSIDPFPRPFLNQPLAGFDGVLQQPVQSVPLHLFEELQSGDFLFIDSSHVCKTGSDVQFLFLQVLPRLKPGVYIHIHDIFLPEEYPMHWVLEENRSWNEQYLLHAILTHSSRFEVVFGSMYAYLKHREDLARALNINESETFAGSSLWIRKREND